MPLICPAILADTPELYAQQIRKVAAFAHRIQIDLTDGQFASSKTVGPGEAWWPAGVQADFHLMYKNPLTVLPQIIEHHPHMVIVHAEADGDFNDLRDACRENQVNIGLALLPASSPQAILGVLDDIDHVLLFSGDLGSFGGRADLDLLEKAAFLKTHKPGIEIGWDGGINDQNVAQLVYGGVDVLDVGGFIQNADDAEKAFSTLQRIADETGTT